MPRLTEPEPVHGNIMVVDDNPANLKLLEDVLQQRGYEVRLFPLGRLAIAAAQQEPPDLILLDINMPEMDGYEVCRHLKALPALAETPVIFLSALDSVEDKVKGFCAGGVDYISKPFQFEDVEARIETHLKLRRALLAERDLLEKTLGGAASTLWELIQLTSPGLALRSDAVRSLVHWISRQIRPEDAWRYNLAATLCLVGCIALPEDVFERAYGGENLSPDEAAMFRSHPDRGARLLSRIPRLETVAAIIRAQQCPETVPPERDGEKLGAEMLQAALAFDQRFYKGISPAVALADLKRYRGFNKRILGAIESYAPPETQFEVRRLSIAELRASMILLQDVRSEDGKLLILKEGTALTDTWIERLKNFSKVRRTRDVVEVRVPTLQPQLTEPSRLGI